MAYSLNSMQSKSSLGYGFYEFFAGGGMARAGLGKKWTCLFANDIDPKKGMSYSANWGDDVIHIESVANLASSCLAGKPDLVWASFPCQDLSLAGAGAGLKGDRSGTFWPFWNLVKTLVNEHRAPNIIVLENVCGALTSHDGADFAAIGDALAESGYFFGAVVIDAIHFVPQSRPRLFVIAVRENELIPDEMLLNTPHTVWHPANLVSAQTKLSKAAQAHWLWWRLPEPPKRKIVFANFLENEPVGVKWHTPQETQRLLDMMSHVNLEKVNIAKRAGHKTVGTIYRRTRIEYGQRIQRAEIRFDGVAGCLRTPAGGSSRQVIMIIDGKKVQSRLLSPREAARLMGLPDSYILPSNYNEAYHLIGDGLVVPVVRFLAGSLLEPLLQAQESSKREVA